MKIQNQTIESAHIQSSGSSIKRISGLVENKKPAKTKNSILWLAAAANVIFAILYFDKRE